MEEDLTQDKFSIKEIVRLIEKSLEKLKSRRA